MSNVESLALEKGRGGAGTGLERSSEKISLLRMVFGCVAIGALLIAALFAPWIAPHDPTLDDLFLINMPPAWLNDDLAHFGIENAWAYPLGTDS